MKPQLEKTAQSTSTRLRPSSGSRMMKRATAKFSAWTSSVAAMTQRKPWTRSEVASISKAPMSIQGSAR